jgi:hypothetical protein
LKNELFFLLHLAEAQKAAAETSQARRSMYAWQMEPSELSTFIQDTPAPQKHQLLSLQSVCSFLSQLVEAQKAAAEASQARSTNEEVAGAQKLQGEAAEGLRQDLARLQRQVDQKETALQESRRLATAKEQVRY